MHADACSSNLGLRTNWKIGAKIAHYKLARNGKEGGQKRNCHCASVSRTTYYTDLLCYNAAGSSVYPLRYSFLRSAHYAVYVRFPQGCKLHLPPSSRLPYFAVRSAVVFCPFESIILAAAAFLACHGSFRSHPLDFPTDSFKTAEPRGRRGKTWACEDPGPEKVSYLN